MGQRQINKSKIKVLKNYKNNVITLPRATFLIIEGADSCESKYPKSVWEREKDTIKLKYSNTKQYVAKF